MCKSCRHNMFKIGQFCHQRACIVSAGKGSFFYKKDTHLPVIILYSQYLSEEGITQRISWKKWSNSDSRLSYHQLISATWQQNTITSSTITLFHDLNGYQHNQGTRLSRSLNLIYATNNDCALCILLQTGSEVAVLFIFFSHICKRRIFNIKSVLVYFEWFGVLNTPKAY